MRSFLQPIHLRRVALILLIGWVTPLMGTLGVSIIFAGGLADSSKHGKVNKEVTTALFPQESGGNEEDKTLQIAEQGSEAINNDHQGQAETSSGAWSSPSPTQVQGYGDPTGNSAPTTGGNQATTPAGEVNQERNAHQPDEGQVYLLARVINAEARGEPFEGQVAVGAVLVNRLRDPKFPSNLWGIIFDKGEFCTVRDGQVWLAPNNEAYRAARLALSGWDPSYGARFFYNPAKTTSKWIWSRPITTKIGNHVFAR